MRINDAAPDFELPDLNGGLHKLSEYRGQVVILNFWSCECPHVERTDELISNWCEKKWGRYVSLLRVASNASESTAVLKEAAARKQIPLLLLDRQGFVAGLYAEQREESMKINKLAQRLKKDRPMTMEYSHPQGCN